MEIPGQTGSIVVTHVKRLMSHKIPKDHRLSHSFGKVFSNGGPCNGTRLHNAMHLIDFSKTEPLLKNVRICGGGYMPLDVSCTCGKQFKVFEELAGQAIRCHACGSMTRVPSSEGEGLPDIDDGSPTVACPWCCEQIPKKSRACPMCKEVFPQRTGRRATAQSAAPEADNAEQQLIAARVRESLDAANPTLDDTLRGGMLSAKTVVGFVLVVLSVILFFFGTSSRDLEGLIVFAFFAGAISFVAAAVSLTNDMMSVGIHKAPHATKALERYLTTVKTGRAMKAFSCLLPMSRTVAAAETIRFKNKKIDNVPRTFSFNDPNTFNAYWKYNFSGPFGVTRHSKIKGFRSVGKSPEGFEVVEARIEITSHSTILYFVGLIFVLIFQEKEEVVIRKALARHNGRWYILDGSLEGELDRVI